MLRRLSFVQSFSVFFALLYAVGLCWVAASHEPWRDEANWFLLAREAPLFSSVFWGEQLVRFSGSGWLWYGGVVAPLARLGFPVELQSVVSAAFVGAALGVFLLGSGLPRWFSATVFLTAHVVAYDWAIVARGYSLSLLLTGCALAARRSHPRAWWVSVGLLCNTSAYGMVLGVAFAVSRWVEMRSHRSHETDPRAEQAGRWVALVLVVLGVSTLIPHPDFVRVGHDPGIGRVPALLHGAFFPFGRGVAYDVLGAGLAGLAVAAAAVGPNRRQALAFIAVALGGFAAIVTFVHGGMPRHHGFVLLTFVAAAAIAGSGRLWRGWMVATAVALAVTNLPATMYFIRHDLDPATPFSGGAAAAAAIKQWVPEEGALVFTLNSAMAPVLVHLGDGFPAVVGQIEDPAATHRRYFLENAAHAALRETLTDAERLRIAARWRRDLQLPWILATVGVFDDPALVGGSFGYSPAWGGPTGVFGATDEVYLLLAPPAPEVVCTLQGWIDAGLCGVEPTQP